MPLNYVKELKVALNSYIKKVEALGDVQCLIVKDDVTKLKAKAERYLIYFKEMKVDSNIILELQKVINQIKDFENFVLDTINSRLSHSSM